ncbi:MAG: aspartate carbamoyltransferase catalytic subunit [Actinobacteria bacterium]|nr:aspartate carbamoyltransferase catalytic subunit [Actinomycetota bacterium]MBU1942217.1 aspartate carbamoyltransferase catalytic subunit [Actinomycetota bacterium]MBU2687434.1 aspartate carbamoyltransferase catalytic subunit [Actinomycetota bacterium]
MGNDHRHLLAIADLGREDIIRLLDSARSFAEVSARPVKKVPALRGHTIVNLFLEPSTRTRMSFELAAKRLSADVMNFSTSTSSLSKGESLKDTGKTIVAMGVDAVVIRHKSAGAPRALTGWVDCSVVNAGDGMHEHPTQALLDLFTMRERLGGLEGLKVAIVGDIDHSRVARSNILALGKVGAEVLLVAPRSLLPEKVEEMGARVTGSMDEALAWCDVLYLLRIQMERVAESRFPSLREYTLEYGLTQTRWSRLERKPLVMHPGPMNRGVEIASVVADEVESVITGQVSAGVAVRMAVLFELLGGGHGG